MIKFVNGDATRPQVEDPKKNAIIAHICNNVGAWGAGFTAALSNRWPNAAFRSEVKMFKGHSCLGLMWITWTEEHIAICNMVAQDGIGTDRRRIDYNALRGCLKELGARARLLNATIHMPRIGCGLAGGDWDTVEGIIKDELNDMDVTVYDLGTPNAAPPS